jgi:hypothetical protein
VQCRHVSESVITIGHRAITGRGRIELALLHTICPANCHIAHVALCQWC